MPQSTSSPADGKKPPKSTFWKSFVRIVRLVLIVGILWLGWETLRAYFRMFSGPQPVVSSIEDEELELPPSPAEFWYAHPDEGPWTLANLPWKLRTVAVAEDKLEETLRQAPVTTTPAAPISKEEQSILKLTQLLASKKQKLADFDLYVAQRGAWHASAFVKEIEGSNRLVMIRLAFREKDKRWLLLELTPGNNSDGAASSQLPVLLPFPDKAKVLCQRWNRKGQIIGELLSIPAVVDELRQTWENHGWATKRFKRHGNACYFVCLRGNEAVGVWASFPEELTRPALLLLVRLPKKDK